VNLTRGLWGDFVIRKILFQFLTIHFVHINFIQCPNRKWLLVVLYRPKGYRAIHVANDEEMASWVYSERGDVRPTMFEKILSNDSLAFQDDKERKCGSQGRYSPNLLGPLQV
jgi:hypothetical protein